MHFVKDTQIRSALIEFADGPDIAVAGTGNLEFELVCEDGLIRVHNDGEELAVRRKEARSGFDPVPVEPLEHWSGTVRKIRDLVQADPHRPAGGEQPAHRHALHRDRFRPLRVAPARRHRRASPDPQPRPHRVELVGDSDL